VGDWFGDGLAMLLSVLVGVALTLLRLHPYIPVIPMVAGSGLVAAIMAAPLVDPFQLAAQSYLWLALMGLLQMPIASILMMLATRYLSSPEVSLFLLIETVLGPIWVWWVVGEMPPERAIYGGVIIVLAIAFHSAIVLSQSRRSVPV